MNELMEGKIRTCSEIPIGLNQKKLIAKRVRQTLRNIKYIDGCLPGPSNRAGKINIEFRREKLTDYTGVEAYFSEFRVQDKLYDKASFSEIWYFVLLFEKMLGELFPDLRIETVFFEDNLGYYGYRFYQYRENEGHYSINVNNCDYPKRVNQLWLR